VSAVYSPDEALAARLERIAALSDVERHRLLGLLCGSAPGVVEQSLVLLHDDGAIARARPGAGPLGPPLARRRRARWWAR
jgi:hypothetical protein